MAGLSGESKMLKGLSKREFGVFNPSRYEKSTA